MLCSGNFTQTMLRHARFHNADVFENLVVKLSDKLYVEPNTVYKRKLIHDEVQKMV